MTTKPHTTTTTTAPLRRRLLPLLAWCATLVAIASLAGATGHGALAPPPLSEPSAWADWAGARTPVQAAFAVLRLAVVGASWYLLAVTVLATVARVVRARPLVTLLDVVTVPVVCRVVQSAVGVSMAGTSMVGVLAGSMAPAGAAEAPPPVMVLVPDEAAEVTPAPYAAPVLPAPTPAPAAPTTMAQLAPTAQPAPHIRTWEVEPGDHLWSVAEQVVTAASGTAPSDSEVTAYWSALLEANRGTLADPENPDIIFPGQLLVVPELPA